MKKYSVVLDTNVFISSIVFGGNQRQILNLIIEGKVKLYISKYILEEIENVLQRPKFGYSKEIVQSIIQEILIISYVVHPKHKIETIITDKDDNRILECAYESKSDFIITGDIHLLELIHYKNIKIITPLKFLNLL